MKCKELITKGKNKGKMCYQVNKYCSTKSHKMNKTRTYGLDGIPKCHYCGKEFMHKSNIYRHVKEHCPKRSEFHDSLNTINNTYNTQNETNNTSNRNVNTVNYNTNCNTNNINNTINENINNYNTNNTNNNNIQQSINIICVGSNDDFTKILSERMGENEAKNYILECAKNNLEGDINLLKKIYFDGKKEIEYPIKFLDKSRNKVEFIDENFEKVLDPTGIELSKRLCGNLQNGYLLHVNQILEANLNQQDDGKFLDEFDLLNCQNHIYELSSQKYRRMLLSVIPERIHYSFKY